MLGWYITGLGVITASVGVVGYVLFTTVPDTHKHRYIDLLMGTTTDSLDYDEFMAYSHYLDKIHGRVK